MNTSKGNVDVIADPTDWDAKVQESNDTGNIIVVEFTATWCGTPCQNIASTFAALSVQYDNLLFATADIDDLDELVNEFGVDTPPTFVFVEDGKKIDEVVGARRTALTQKCSQYN